MWHKNLAWRDVYLYPYLYFTRRTLLFICLPLLICTLNAYSPHAALHPQGALPLFFNATHEPAASEDRGGGGGGTVPVYIMLLPAPRPAQTGCVLSLAFVIAAAVLSVLSILAHCWSGSPAGDACGGRVHA